MARKYTKRRKYRYTPKQVNYFMRITKDVQKLKAWTRWQKRIKQRVIKDLNQADKKMLSLKRENAKLKAEKRRKLALNWATKQGIDLQKDYKGELQQIAEQKTRKLIKQAKHTTNIIDYLKPNTISQARRNYTSFTEDTSGIYNELLDKAMQNPTEFKKELIEQIDKLKNLIETEINIYGNYKGNIFEKAKLTTRGKTIEEIKQALQEFGIRPGTVLPSETLKNFARKINTSNWGYDRTEGEITEIAFTIRLIRGK